MYRPIRFDPVNEAVREPVTKLGGQPVWLAEPQWPLSASQGTPMPFIGQFEIPGTATESPRLAYLFMTDDAEGTWVATGGENALIIQPDGRVPDFVAVRPLRIGPSAIPGDRVPVDDFPPEGETPWEHLGGEPLWIQGDETPDQGWKLLVQLTDRYGTNFGDAGIGYAFVSPDHREGRFLWQCY